MEESNNEDRTVDYDGWTKAQLIEECRRRYIKVDGCNGITTHISILGR